MDYQTEKVILHFVTEDDLAEVAGKWPADHHPLSDAEAREAIAYMRGNYERNTKGCIYHLCLAVCGKEHPETIMGWCGLDGTRKTDLLGSLCDLTSGSGDKGTPIIWIQGYFDNFTM